VAFRPPFRDRARGSGAEAKGAGSASRIASDVCARPRAPFGKDLDPYFQLVTCCGQESGLEVRGGKADFQALKPVNGMVRRRDV
jgi:hypothetical protein